MKIVKGTITEIGNSVISRTGTLFSNVMVLTENGDRMRITDLACDDATSNHIILNNEVTLHVAKVGLFGLSNALIAVEDSHGLTVARGPSGKQIITSLLLGGLLVYSLYLGSFLGALLLGALFLFLGVPTLGLLRTIAKFTGKSNDPKRSRVIEV